MRPERVAMVGGACGIAFGGLSWMVILGVAINSIPLITLPALVAILSILFIPKLYDINPERKLSILGLAIIAVIMLNFFAINMVYDRIPDNLWQDAPRKFSCLLTTGKSGVSLLMINIYLTFFGLAGCALILADVLKRKR